MAADNVSFTSRINFVDAKTFEKFRRGAYIDFRTSSSIKNVQNGQKPWFAKFESSDIVNADEFYTDEIRTCSAGGVIDLKTGNCAGFHFLDNLDNLIDIKHRINAVFRLVPNPDRALILGSKKLTCSKYSIQIFEEVLNALKSKIKDVTVFREHIFPYSETDFHYSLKNDTWTIHSMYRPLADIKIHPVDSKLKLDSCFREIEIADGDSIHFV